MLEKRVERKVSRRAPSLAGREGQGRAQWMIESSMASVAPTMREGRAEVT